MRLQTVTILWCTTYSSFVRQFHIPTKMVTAEVMESGEKVNDGKVMKQIFSHGKYTCNWLLN